MMYDVSSPNSLKSLKKWWDEFKEKAPVMEGEEEDFCCAVVGNKVDVRDLGGVGEAGSSAGAGTGILNGGANGNGQAKTRAKGKWKVSEEEALAFLEDLIPRASLPPPGDDTRDMEQGTSSHQTSARSNGDAVFTSEDSHTRDESQGDLSSPSRQRSKSMSITITDNTHHRHHSPPNTRALSPSFARTSRSRSAARLGYGSKNSISSLATRESIYHTPSSSYFDVYESARTSPVPFPGDGSSPPDRLVASGSVGRGRGSGRIDGSASGSGAGLGIKNGRRGSTSSSSISSSSALTITQSLFARSTTPGPATISSPPTAPQPQLPILEPPERRPKLFFTSAKTGEGVSEVFQYVAKRVVGKWEWDMRAREQEWDQSGWEGEGWEGGDIIRVGLRDGLGKKNDGLGMKIARGCCAS